MVSPPKRERWAWREVTLLLFEFKALADVQRLSLAYSISEACCPLRPAEHTKLGAVPPYKYSTAG